MQAIDDILGDFKARADMNNQTIMVEPIIGGDDCFILSHYTAEATGCMLYYRDDDDTLFSLAVEDIAVRESGSELIFNTTSDPGCLMVFGDIPVDVL